MVGTTTTTNTMDSYDENDEGVELLVLLQSLLAEDGILETMLPFIDTPKVAMMRRVNKRWYKYAGMALNQNKTKQFKVF
jgi:hypothetical protein